MQEISENMCKSVFVCFFVEADIFSLQFFICKQPV